MLSLNVDQVALLCIEVACNCKRTTIYVLYHDFEILIAGKGLQWLGNNYQNFHSETLHNYVEIQS